MYMHRINDLELMIIEHMEPCQASNTSFLSQFSSSWFFY